LLSGLLSNSFETPTPTVVGRLSDTRRWDRTGDLLNAIQALSLIRRQPDGIVMSGSLQLQRACDDRFSPFRSGSQSGQTRSDDPMVAPMQE
jgi:hypothetical protein